MERAVSVTVHLVPKREMRSLITREAAEMQRAAFSRATKDLFEALERGDFAESKFNVKFMADGEHPELDFDKSAVRCATTSPHISLPNPGGAIRHERKS